MKEKSIYSALLVAIIAFNSCSKFDENLNSGLCTENRLVTETAENEQAYREGELILGKHLKNPYTVENMAQAARHLLSEGLSQLDPAKIRASHYYVKFMPADSSQFVALENDRKLTLYPYPLDYEIIQRGNHYRDPATPRGGFAYQYAAVKVDYPFNPKIPYEIISPLYIPEEDPFLKNTVNEDYLDHLLDRAYVQTENYDDTIKVDKGKSEKKHPYNPAGKIQIFDTRLNQLIGLEGVDMRARRWFTTYHARTDFNGDYEMDDNFKRPCNYSLWFSQEDFTVKPHLIDLTAWIDGPKKEGDWDYNILSGYDRFVGHIFRGAYRYHYGFIDGLKRPFRPSGHRTIYIGKNDSKSWAGINYMILPVIKIARYDGNMEYDSDEIFSATCHETAHTSHAIQSIWGLMSYAISSEQIRESWAIGIEWWLTKLEYKNTRGISNYGDWDYDIYLEYPNWLGYQYWNKSQYSADYTSLFINIVDNYNDSTGFISSPEDEVTGYTFSELETKVMYSSFSKSSVASELKKIKPAGITDEQIDKLISYY